jgi:hypothetical protein
MFKYHEETLLKEVESYLKSTYGQHYVNGVDSIQTFDFWRSLGSAETTSRDLAVKYLARYGKKDGKNRKDLLKALHFIFFMLYLHDEEFKTEFSSVEINTSTATIQLLLNSKGEPIVDSNKNSNGGTKKA